MRDVDWRLVPRGGILTLLTMEDLIDGHHLMIADFRDMKALFHKETGSWVGLTRGRGIRLGRPPLRLQDGIWYINEDMELGKTKRNFRLTADVVSLEVIEGT